MFLTWPQVLTYSRSTFLSNQRSDFDDFHTIGKLFSKWHENVTFSGLWEGLYKPKIEFKFKISLYIDLYSWCRENRQIDNYNHQKKPPCSPSIVITLPFPCENVVEMTVGNPKPWGRRSPCRFFFWKKSGVFAFARANPTPTPQGPISQVSAQESADLRPRTTACGLPPGPSVMPTGLGFDFGNCALGRGCRVGFEELWRWRCGGCLTKKWSMSYRLF